MTQIWARITMFRPKPVNHTGVLIESGLGPTLTEELRSKYTHFGDRQLDYTCL